LIDQEALAMKIGVITALYQDQPFEAMLDAVAEMGLQAVRLGTGAWPGNAHCKPDELRSDLILQTLQTVGYGHDPFTWRTPVSTPRLVGYEYRLSIEDEDPMLSAEEGFSRAVSFLKDVLLTGKPAVMGWA
jgi:sugar phosphate isomerase/epimerase